MKELINLNTNRSNEDEPLNIKRTNEDESLKKLGYNPLLARSLDSIMSFAIGFTRVNTVIGIAPLFCFGEN